MTEQRAARSNPDQLMDSIQADDIERVRILLDSQPELRAKLNDPIGPFDSPALTSARSRAMVDVLLAAGADVNAKSQWWAGGFGILHIADIELAEYAVDRGAVVDIHAASRLGRLDRLREIVEADPQSVHARGGDGQTPLHFARTVEIAAYLLDHGADIDARDIDHESTPAQWMLGDRIDVARYLVERGCSTDILLAASVGDLDLVRKHLDTDPECIRVRVSADFFPMINPKAGGKIYQWTLGYRASPFKAAARFGHADVLQLLMERSPAEVKMIAACWLHDGETVASLLSQRSGIAHDLSEADRDELAHAARNNDTQAALLMLEAGLAVSGRGQHRGTPLHWAAWHGNLELVRALLRNDPPLDDSDNDFHSPPLGWAMHGSENGWHADAGDYPAVVEALLQAGVKLPKGFRGRKPSRKCCAGTEERTILLDMTRARLMFGIVLPNGMPEDRQEHGEDSLRTESEISKTDEEHPLSEGAEEWHTDEVQLLKDVLLELESSEPDTNRQNVGVYELLNEIGRGSGGIVYQARERGIEPLEVAINLLGPAAVNSYADAELFIKEVRAMIRIDHEHIVPYRSSGNDRGQLYYVMKLMRGSDLGKFLKERPEPLTPLETARYMIQIARAVSYLHAQQPPIVHRDLKPRNILRDETGKLYVADFGLAVLHEDQSADLQHACGTYPYIAPEQFDSRFGEVGPSSDIYSLGVIFYEMLAGKPPFPRSPESKLLPLNSEPIPPGRYRTGIPDALERICLKCLRKATRDRYSSTDQLVEELNHFEHGEPLVHTEPHTVWQRVRDWARSEPALAARLAVIVACSVIIWSFRAIVGRFAPIHVGHWVRQLADSGVLRGYNSVAAVLVWLSQVILVAWGLASWAFQPQLTRKREEGGLQLGWRFVDVLALSLLIEIDDALMSPLTVAFAVLIVASALWARADQFLQTTLLSMSAYVALMLIYTLTHHGLDHPYRHFHYLVALALLGFMLIHQANRTCALARICGAMGR